MYPIILALFVKALFIQIFLHFPLKIMRNDIHCDIFKSSFIIAFLKRYSQIKNMYFATICSFINRTMDSFNIISLSFPYPFVLSSSLCRILFAFLEDVFQQMEEEKVSTIPAYITERHSFISWCVVKSREGFNLDVFP